MQTDFYASPEAPLALRPIIHPFVGQVIGTQGFLRELVMALGSPLNIMFPDMVGHNVGEFNHAFKHHKAVEGRIFFAHKPTQSDSLLRKAAAIPKVGADVASLGEMQHALSCGFSGQRMLATGPKNTDFLTLCILHGVTVSVDSVDELQHIMHIRAAFNLDLTPTQVLLRVVGFAQSPLAKASRFGIHINDIPGVLDMLKAHTSNIDLLGFAFHLDSTSLQERLIAIATCLKLFEAAVDRGFQPKVLDIGGGFKINYLQHEGDWNQYIGALQQAVLGKRSPITWHNVGFGLTIEKGHLRGTFNSYAFYESRPGMLFLCDILGATLPGYDERVDTLLGSNMIQVWIEPGLALLDQAGFTVARVNGIRASSQGHALVLLDMKRSDVTVLEREIFVDPVIIYADQTTANPPTPVYFAGNLCLENDLVYRHLTWVPRVPSAGDLVVFPNTAGYSMDFSASNTMLQPVAKKVTVCQHPTGGFAWMLDSQYSPTWLLKQ